MQEIDCWFDLGPLDVLSPVSCCLPNAHCCIYLACRSFFISWVFASVATTISTGSGTDRFTSVAYVSVLLRPHGKCSLVWLLEIVLCLITLLSLLFSHFLVS
jgi:hypothetical protein